MDHCRPATRENPITAKWIFKLKKDSDGKIAKLKAMIVARDFQQTEGVDFVDIFAPVVCWSTIRTILALTSKSHWPVRQMDVIIALPNDTFTDKVFMEIPKGFQGAGDNQKVCPLNKALYGLRHAPRAWYERINSWLRAHGLTRSSNDSNLYYSCQVGRYTIVLI